MHRSKRTQMTTPDFTSLMLHDRTLAAVDAAGYSTPTEVQHRAIPELLAGRDVLATAQTGTGKTAAFVLPMLQLVKRAQATASRATPSALILAPTRELAAQIVESIKTYGRGSRLKALAIIGGDSRNRQLRDLGSHPDIIVATPGRLLDFMSEGRIDLRHVSYLILDEGDRMLDMGFIPAVRKIMESIPSNRQTALFSATMPTAVRALANDLLTNPVSISAEAGELRIDRITQSVMYVDQADKFELLSRLISERGMYKVLVFTRTKHRASKVAKLLIKRNLTCDAIHGDKSQSARTRALANFKNGKIQVLVATDVASRGIDVDDITHVVNFELPNEAETYVHRIGRTARAGASGNAISFCNETEMPYLRDIERLVGISLSVDKDQPYHQERRLPAQRKKPSTAYSQQYRRNRSPRSR